MDPECTGRVRRADSRMHEQAEARADMGANGEREVEKEGAGRGEGDRESRGRQVVKRAQGRGEGAVWRRGRQAVRARLESLDIGGELFVGARHGGVSLVGAPATCARRRGTRLRCARGGRDGRARFEA
eukprot:5034320-Pleurochrysis_carterae.AAC.1